MFSFQLTVPQLGVAWQRLGLGEPPTIWAHGARAAAGDDPLGQLHDADRELDELGLLGVDGGVLPELADLLRAVASAPTLVDLRYTAAGRCEVRALVVVDGVDAARGVLAEGAVHLEGGPAASAAAALVGTLPEVPAAPGREVTLPAEAVDRGVKAALARGNGSDAAVADELVLLGLSEHDVRALMALTGGRRTLYGQFGVTVRDAVRGRRRCADIVQVVDTCAGRAAMSTFDGVLRVAPAGDEEFVTLLGALVSRAWEQIGR